MPTVPRHASEPSPTAMAALTPSARPATSRTTSDPNAATDRCAAQYLARATGVPSTGSVRSLVSSLRRRSIDWMAYPQPISAVIRAEVAR